MPGTVATKTSKDKNTGQVQGRSPEPRHYAPGYGLESDMLSLQQTVGNQAVSQALDVSGGSSSTLASGIPLVVQSVVNSNGQPLDLSTRSFMESRFGQDFSQVRVHTDAQAAESARAVNAAAYTVGQNVVFDSGKYAPTSASGKHLLAHELAHSIQQRGEPQQGTFRLSQPGDRFERAANSAAQAIDQGHDPPPQPTAPQMISRATDDEIAKRKRHEEKLLAERRRETREALKDPKLKKSVKDNRHSLVKGKRFLLTDLAPSQLEEYWKGYKENLKKRIKEKKKKISFFEYVRNRLRQERGDLGEITEAFHGRRLRGEVMVAAPNRKPGNAPGIDLVTFDPKSGNIKLIDNKSFKTEGRVGDASALNKNLTKNIGMIIDELEAIEKNHGLPKEIKNKILPRLKTLQKKLAKIDRRHGKRNTQGSAKHKHEVRRALERQGVQRVITLTGSGENVKVSRKKLLSEGFIVEHDTPKASGTKNTLATNTPPKSTPNANEKSGRLGNATKRGARRRRRDKLRAAVGQRKGSIKDSLKGADTKKASPPRSSPDVKSPRTTPSTTPGTALPSKMPPSKWKLRAKIGATGLAKIVVGSVAASYFDEKDRERYEKEASKGLARLQPQLDKKLQQIDPLMPAQWNFAGKQFHVIIKYKIVSSYRWSDNTDIIGTKEDDYTFDHVSEVALVGDLQITSTPVPHESVSKSDPDYIREEVRRYSIKVDPSQDEMDAFVQQRASELGAQAPQTSSGVLLPAGDGLPDIATSTFNDYISQRIADEERRLNNLDRQSIDPEEKRKKQEKIQARILKWQSLLPGLKPHIEKEKAIRKQKEDQEKRTKLNKRRADRKAWLKEVNRRKKQAAAKNSKQARKSQVSQNGPSLTASLKPAPQVKPLIPGATANQSQIVARQAKNAESYGWHLLAVGRRLYRSSRTPTTEEKNQYWTKVAEWDAAVIYHLERYRIHNYPAAAKLEAAHHEINEKMRALP